MKLEKFAQKMGLAYMKTRLACIIYLRWGWSLAEYKGMEGKPNSLLLAKRNRKTVEIELEFDQPYKAMAEIQAMCDNLDKPFEQKTYIFKEGEDGEIIAKSNDEAINRLIKLGIKDPVVKLAKHHSEGILPDGGGKVNSYIPKALRPEKVENIEVD